MILRHYWLILMLMVKILYVGLFIIIQNTILKILQNIYKTLHQIQNSNKMCVILGDFNINLFNSDIHQPTEDFSNNMYSYFMNPQIIQPTRITDHTAILIDNIFLNSIEYNTISGNLLTDTTDHLPNFLIINRIGTFKKENIYKRNYLKINQERIVNEVQTINWDSSLLDCDNPNDIFCSTYDKVTEVIDTYAPMDEEAKFTTKPWITLVLNITIRIKNMLYR